jgi:uncharacterized protein (TIGR02453 family)
MITKKITDFLELLKENNNRDWFNANKNLYTEVKKEFEGFTSEMIANIGNFDKEIQYLEPKDCTYRIYRDTRFSNDKTPYKINIGAYMTKGGKNSGFAGYYFHIEPGNYFLAGGIYMPMPDVLKKVRTEIYENTDEFISIIQNPVFLKHFGPLDDSSKLKTPPKGFPKDFQHIEYLKFKNYLVEKPVSARLLFSDGLMKEIVEVFQAMMPMNKFLNAAISGND